VLGSERAADGEVVYAALPQRVLGVADVGVEPGDRDLSVLATSESAGNPPAPRDPDGTFFAIFTSGTTGLPKASRMTHRRWAKASATYGHLLLTLTPDDAIYVALPLFHNMALTVALSAAVATGARIVLRRRFSASAFWDDCREHHITCFPYIGELPRFLLAQPPSPRDRDHRVTQMVGVGLREATWRAFTERFSVPHVIEHYGASESNTLFVNVIDVPGSVGFCPSPHRLVEWDADEDAPLRDGAGVPLDAPPGEAGMLLTKINDRFRYDGYADPAASERRLLRSLYESDDCWFVTGDLLRAAGWGHYVFVDRAGDTWRWRGENVSAQQVEDVARTTPFPLADCAAYGVSVPGAEGRAGMLAIVSEPPDDAAIDVLLDGIAAALLPAAVPLFVRRVPDLPRTETMKTQKGGLRADGWDVADVWVRLPGRRAERLGDSLRRAIREGNAGL
jgi:fatty-acyl-CoA synthase